MDPERLNQQLHELTVDLDDPTLDLQSMRDHLLDSLLDLFPSFLGMTITLHPNDQPITLTTADPGSLAAARACLLLPLSTVGATSPGDSLVFYAGTPGAFTALAGNSTECVVLDPQLPILTDPAHQPGIDGLVELTTTNRAIGMLIAAESTPKVATNGH
jgi:hypothetical protein